MPFCLIQSKKHMQGFSLIEVIVSVFILAVGVLGIASMQTASIKMNQGAFHQSQANILINDIFDRMRANRDAFLAGDYDDANTANDVPAAQACITSAAGCTSSQLALQDIREITAYLRDISNQGNSFAALIPDGNARVVRDTDTNTATVTVTWKQDVWSQNNEGVAVKSISNETLSMSVRI